MGSKILIGDNVYLTAGHMAYEYNHSKDSNPNAITISDIVSRTSTSDAYTVINDYRSYQAKYASQVKSDYIANPKNHSTNEVNEAKIIANDSVLISGSDKAGSADYGMVLFVSPSDLQNSATTLSKSKISFDGYVSGVVTGGTVSSAANGQLIYSIADKPGDSGGAFLLGWSGKTYIVGTLAGKGSAGSYGTYFTTADWASIQVTLANGQAGNVSANEPTNLIVGTTAAETALSGTYRPDIILGRDGADKIDGGDQASASLKAWANDQIYGGAGNDTILGGYGNDLIHGGNMLVDGTGNIANTDAQINADGTDVVDYTGLTATDPTLGITVMVDGTHDFTFGEPPDLYRSVTVMDRGRDHGVDSLISIERIVGTSADDILIVSRMDLFGLASYDKADRVGGLDTVDLGGQSKGDLLDLTFHPQGEAFAYIIDASIATPYLTYASNPVGKLYFADIEQFKLSDVGDTFHGSSVAERVGGGAGRDIIYGGAGDDILFASRDQVANGNIDQLYGDAGNDVLVATYGTQMYGGAGNDTFMLPKLSKSTSMMQIYDSDPGDALIWNGYTLRGGAAYHVETDHFVDGNGMANRHQTFGYVDSLGSIYFFISDGGPGPLRIMLPDGTQVQIAQWQQGDLGITLTGPSFTTEQYIQPDDPFPTLPFTNIYDDGVWSNYDQLDGRAAALAGTGPTPLPALRSI